MAEIEEQPIDQVETQDWAQDEIYDEPQIIEEPKIFGTWSFTDVQCGDIALADHINFKGKYAKYLPHNSDRYNKIRFKKTQCYFFTKKISQIQN